MAFHFHIRRRVIKPTIALVRMLVKAYHDKIWTYAATRHVVSRSAICRYPRRLITALILLPLVFLQLKYRISDVILNRVSPVVPVVSPLASLRSDHALVTLDRHTSRSRSRYTSLITDVKFTVKTSEKNHGTKLKMQLETWIAQVPGQVHIITDTDKCGLAVSERIESSFLVVTGCGNDHEIESLRCKTNRELLMMVASKSQYRWFCHLDDDTYVHTAGLMATLNRYNWTVPTLIGRFHVNDDDRMSTLSGGPLGFAMGMSYCLSQALLYRISPSVIGMTFLQFSQQIYDRPDDITVSVLSWMYGGTTVINSDNFYSHFKGYGYDRDFRLKKFKQMATLEMIWGKNYGNLGMKVNNLSPCFDSETDPTRIYTIHCHFNPHVHYCGSLFRSNRTHLSKPLRIGKRTRIRNRLQYLQDNE